MAIRSKWDKITLFKFQEVEAINATDMSDIDKTLYSICTVFDVTEHALDTGGAKNADRLARKLNDIFSSPFEPVRVNRVGLYSLDYDPAKMTFGQYVDLCFFLAQNPIQHCHHVIATISRRIGKKYTAEGHKKRADYFLNKPVAKLIGSLNYFVERFKAFNNEYKSLFGLDSETHEPEAQVSFFIRRYGWTYSATRIAEYERITLEAAYNLPIRQALNDLAYLKEKDKYDAEQAKKVRNGRTENYSR